MIFIFVAFWLGLILGWLVAIAGTWAGSKRG